MLVLHELLVGVRDDSPMIYHEKRVEKGGRIDKRN